MGVILCASITSKTSNILVQSAFNFYYKNHKHVKHFTFVFYINKSKIISEQSCDEFFVSISCQGAFEFRYISLEVETL
jgi:hypothetical protein